MFETTFKNIDDILYKDAGCSSELDYVEQSSWVLFLKYIDDLESARKIGAELGNTKYQPIINGKYRWSEWAVPKGKDGKIDYNKALTGDDLTAFVNTELFVHLGKFKSTATSPDTLEYKIGEIFSEIRNKIQSGYNLRDVVELVDQLKFQTSADIHEMSHLYEDKIKNMGNAGRNGGEYYTPRPLIKTIIKLINPKIGQTIYDGATGSAGFLCESFAYLSESKKLTTSDVATLQTKTFYGKEKKSLAYIIGTMNMILHGIDAPNLIHTNTLSENIADIQEKDRYDIVLANPPFGGKEREEVQQNFPIKSSETAYLFLQHFIKIMKAGGKAGIVIKSSFYSNDDSASVSLRKSLLENCNLHTVLLLPGGVFKAGLETTVLFFEKGQPTKDIWFYQLNLDRNLGKKFPLSDKDLEEFLQLQPRRSITKNSWLVDTSSYDPETFDMTPRNPQRVERVSNDDPKSFIQEIIAYEKRTIEILAELEAKL